MGLEIIYSNTFSNPALRQLPAALGFTDTFNRADGALGTTTVGEKTWTTGTGWAIVSNQAKFTGASDAFSWVDMNLTDFTATLDIAEINGAYPFGFALGTPQNGFKFFRTGTNTQWQAIKFGTGGSGSVAAAAAATFGTGTLTITRSGQAVTVINNGGTPFVFSLGANVIPTGTYFGLAGSGGAAGTPLRIDNLVITP